MPISSTETSRILNDQINMFGAAKAYAEAITRQQSDSAGLEDPREPSVAARRAEAATNLGSFAARAPGALMGAASMGAEFGFGPRVMGGFMQTIHSGQQGYKAAGMAGALGTGAAVAGAYWGLGMAGDWMTKQMVSGAQERGMVNSALGQAMPGASAQQVGQIAGQVESAARSGIGNIRDITQVMQQAISSGSVDTGSATEFSTTFGKLIDNVRTVATTLRSTLSDAYQTMQSVKAMGVDSDQVVSTIQTMRGVGVGSGLSPIETFGAAQSGAQMARTLGAEAGQTVQGSVLSAGLYNMAQREGVGGIHAGSQGQYTQAALRFFGSNRGNKVLGAMINQSGELDPVMAARVAGGHVSREEITSAYSKNINSAGMRDILRSRSGELASDFISEQGPSAFAPALRTMFSDSDTPESLKQAITGMTGRDLDAMSALQMRMPELRQKMMAAAQQGLQAGTGGKKDFNQIISRIFDKVSKPLRDKMSAIGAQMNQYSAEVLEDVAGQTGPAAPVNMAASQSLADETAHLTAFGTQGELSRFRSAMAGLPMTGGQSGISFGGAPDPKTWLGGLARDYLPSAIRMGSMGQGTTFSDLPGYGVGFESYKPMQTAAMLSMMPLTPTTGRNAMYGAGAALSWAGRGLAPPGVEVPWGGKGMLEGSTRAVGGTMRGSGALMRTLGRAGSIAFPALMAYDLATNIIPAARREEGMAGIDEGAIRGGSARAIQSLHESGIITGGSVVRKDLTGGDLGGLIPISNTYARGEGLSGTQQFLTSEGVDQLEQLRQGSGSLGADYKQYGGRGEVQSRLRRIKAENPGASDSSLLQITASAFGLTTADGNKGLAYQFAHNEPGFLRSDVSMKRSGTIDMREVRAGFGRRVESFVADAVRDQIATMEIDGSSSPARQRASEFAASLSSDRDTVDALTNVFDSPEYMGSLGNDSIANREKMYKRLSEAPLPEPMPDDIKDTIVNKWARLGRGLKGLSASDMNAPGTLEDAGSIKPVARILAGKLVSGMTDEEREMLMANMEAGRRNNFLLNDSIGKGISTRARDLAEADGLDPSELWASVDDLKRQAGADRLLFAAKGKAAEGGDEKRRASIQGRLSTTQSVLEMAGRIGGLGGGHFDAFSSRLGDLEGRGVTTHQFLRGENSIGQIQKDLALEMLKSTGESQERTVAMAEYMMGSDSQETRQVGSTVSAAEYFLGNKKKKFKQRDFMGRLTESIDGGGYMKTRLNAMSKSSRDFMEGRHNDLTAEMNEWAVTMAKEKLPEGSSDGQIHTLAGEILRSRTDEDARRSVALKFASSGQGAPYSPGAGGGGGEGSADAVMSKMMEAAGQLTGTLLDVRASMREAYNLPPQS